MKKISILLFLLFFTPSLGNSFEVPRLQGYVNDYANMISPSVRGELTARLRSFEESDSTQIVILTIPSLRGETIEGYSIKVVEAWKIGQARKDNGILFTVSKEDRKMRIEVGRGLEGRLTDLVAGRIIDGVARPKFREGDFDGGFKAVVSALIDATRGEFKAEPKPPARARSGFKFHPLYFFMAWILFLVFMIAINRKSGATRRTGRRTYRPGSGWFSTGVTSGGFWSSGGGSSSDSGGGFGGGGGGDFGGGGASGDW